MAGDALNRLNPIPEPGAVYRSGGYPGDLPERIHRRYFTTTKLGAPFAFYTDARSKAPAFRDHGGRLSTDRNDPGIIRDLLAIARHRDWTIIAVRGQTEFRREAWITARQAGLDVRGYRPTERDQQDLDRRTQARASAVPEKGRKHTMKVVEAVVRGRVVEPAEQSRILAVARERLARWLERGATFDRQARHREPAR